MTLPIAPSGPTKYEKLNRRLPELLTKLRSPPSSPLPPKSPGVYLFIDSGTPMYVGQTRNLRNRLAQHCRGSLRQAHFAIRLAKDRLSLSGHDWHELSCNTCTDEFIKAKTDVGNMKIHFVEESNPELRTVFEVYATCMLNTEKFNLFETH